MTPSLASLALAALLCTAPPAFAQGMNHGQMGSGHGAGHGPMMNMPGEMPPVEAEVRRIDKDNGKITLKHGEIKNMDMPPMTMVFNVADKALLEGVAVGDKVRFTASQDKGQMRVESLSVIKP
jgi:Cu(I)/Ag(I) efflux system protein CusF